MATAHERQRPPTPDRLYELFTVALSPRRRRVRLDIESTHVYVDAAMPPAPPPCPHAIYLADQAGRFRLLCFDLDAGVAGADAVVEDLARLRQLLDEAGIGHVVVRSGSSGGRHVWAAVPAGADAAQVAQLARGLAALLPSLDTRPLTNRRTGCARPPGALHRSGEPATLDEGHSPEAAAAILTAGTPPERLEALLALLPPAVREAAVTHQEAPGTWITDPVHGPYLAGDQRALSEATAALVRNQPDNGDQSAHLWRILLGAALARWRRADVARLVADPDAPGLDHIRTRRHGAGGRVPRSDSERDALLIRQWARAVATAASLPQPVRDHDDDPKAAEIAQAVAAVQAAADAMPWRWATQAGPADRAALDAVCLIALTARRLDVALDCRRAAEMTGHAKSTMAAAATRLTRAHPVDGRAWLALDTPASGRAAAVWRLQPIGDDESLSPPVDKGRTQGRKPAPCSHRDLCTQLTARLAHTAHDVWTPQGGLGHHTARTHEALLTGARTTAELVELTSYSLATIRRHLDRLTSYRLAVIGRRDVRAGRGSLDRIATQLDVRGRGDARRRGHIVDRELRAWWDHEIEWRRRRGKPRHHRPRTTIGPGQAVLPVAVGPRATYGPFPRRGRGRADYQRARAIVTARIGAESAAAA